MSVSELPTPVNQIDPELSAAEPTAGTEVLLSVTDLVKSYGDFVAVDGVSFEVRSGEIFVIVGPNGSGKTSTVECIEGLRHPDSGHISLLGQSPDVGPAVYNKIFGAQLQESSLPARIRVKETLELFAHYYDDPWDVDELLSQVGLEPAQHRQYFDTLSGGQKRRLMLALAMLGRPQLIILDEPTSGLDPHARLAMWTLLHQAVADGTTILMTTHDLVEAQEHGSRVALFNEGKVQAVGTPRELIDGEGHRSKVRLRTDETMSEIIAAVDGCNMTRQIEGALYGFGDEEFALKASAAVRDANPDLAHNLISGPVSLEDIYMILTTNSDQEGEEDSGTSSPPLAAKYQQEEHSS